MTPPRTSHPWAIVEGVRVRWHVPGSWPPVYAIDDELEALWEAGQKKPLLMLDLCAGLGGASQAMRDRGWDVITLDNDPRFACDITADVRAWSWHGKQPDLIWLSDPCTEFSRESMPWCRTGAAPDLSIVLAGLRLIRAIRPRYWVRENVRGSLRWVRSFMGEPRERHGPFYLWGDFPSPGMPRMQMRHKESYSSTQRAERAKIPYALSAALAVSIESQMVLL